MLAIINNAKATLLVENEEMGAANIVSALESACQRGVSVHIAMVNDSTTSPYSSYATNFKALEAAGCGVRTYPDTTTGLYIHAKAFGRRLRSGHADGVHGVDQLLDRFDDRESGVGNLYRGRSQCAGAVHDHGERLRRGHDVLIYGDSE